MEKDYVPKHNPVEKKAPAQAHAPTQASKKETKPTASASSTTQTQTPAGDTKATSSPSPTETPRKTSDTPKKEEPKKSSVKITKKDFAMAKVIGLAGSKKYCMYICEFIKFKTIDQALKELNEVLLFKRAIPMRGEIPHRSQPGMMSGRYPIKVTAQFITMLKGLRGNAIVNGMDIHKTIITMGSASWGVRPAKRGGMRFKRTNVTLRVEEKK